MFFKLNLDYRKFYLGRSIILSPNFLKQKKRNPRDPSEPVLHIHVSSSFNITKDKDMDVGIYSNFCIIHGWERAHFDLVYERNDDY